MYFTTGNILLSQSDELDEVVQSYDWLNQAHTQAEVYVNEVVSEERGDDTARNPTGVQRGPPHFQLGDC